MTISIKRKRVMDPQSSSSSSSSSNTSSSSSHSSGSSASSASSASSNSSSSSSSSGIPAPWWWLMADAGVFSDAGTTPSVNNGPVAQWNDQSGNGFHVHNSGSPTFKTGIKNSLPIVRLDGIDDLVTRNVTQQGQPMVIFLVANVTGSPLYILSSGGPSPGTEFGYGQIITGGEYTAHAGATGCHYTFGSIPEGFQVTTIILNGASSQIKINGVSKVTGNAGASRDLVGVTLGGSVNPPSAWTGMDVAEMIIYNSALSSPDEAEVLAYLRAKWGI